MIKTRLCYLDTKKRQTSKYGACMSLAKATGNIRKLFMISMCRGGTYIL